MGDVWAVVPTKDRADLLLSCLNALDGQVQGTVVVNNGDMPLPELSGNVDVIDHPGYPPNISQLWNRGLDHVTEVAGDCEVAVVNDDCEVPPGWVASLTGALHETGAALAYTDRLGRAERVLYTSAPLTTPLESMTGWAFMLRSSLGYRFDESMAWWWSDTAADHDARLAGGTVPVPGPQPVHHHPNGLTVADPALTEQAGTDRVTFAQKYGYAPW